tara:strand:+ start:7134 stop:7571 length:438 start_codon:yes stop_codon:yes gene_type:complete
MNKINQISKTNINYSLSSFLKKKISFILLLLTGVILFPIKIVMSEEIFLTCTAKFEINRGKLIKPDWETSYLTINKDGLISTINDKGIKKEGSTLIRGNTYTITHRDSSNRIKTKYEIHRTYGTYFVNYPQRNRNLIGTCKKGRG